MNKNMNVLIEYYAYGYNFIGLEYHTDAYMLLKMHNRDNDISTYHYDILYQVISDLLDCERCLNWGIEYINDDFKKALINECNECIENEDDDEQIYLYSNLIEILKGC